MHWKLMLPSVDMRLTSTYVYYQAYLWLKAWFFLWLSSCRGLPTVEVNTENQNFEKLNPFPLYFWILEVTRHRKKWNDGWVDTWVLNKEVTRVNSGWAQQKKKPSLWYDPLHVLLLGQSFISNNSLEADSSCNKSIEWISSASDRGKICEKAQCTTNWHCIGLCLTWNFTVFGRSKQGHHDPFFFFLFIFILVYHRGTQMGILFLFFHLISRVLIAKMKRNSWLL